MPRKKTPGQRLRDARKKAGLSHTELANLAGIARARVYELENGRNEKAFAELRAVAKALRVPTSQLLG